MATASTACTVTSGDAAQQLGHKWIEYGTLEVNETDIGQYAQMKHLKYIDVIVIQCGKTMSAETVIDRVLPNYSDTGTTANGYVYFESIASDTFTDGDIINFFAIGDLV